MLSKTALAYIRKITENPTILGIILFGSWARGNNRPDSDVDLIVVQKEGFKRCVENYNGVNFEITYTTPESAQKFWTDNPDDCVDLWQTGQILFDRDGTLKRLEAFANDLKTKGKKKLENDRRKHIEFDINDQLNGIKALLESDPTTAMLLLTSQVQHLCGYYFDFKQLWKPAPKQLIQTLEEKSPEFASLIKEFYTLTGSVKEKWEIVRKLANGIIAQ